MKKPSQCRVLLVEDQRQMRAIIAAVLRSVGVRQIVEAHDGRHAEAALRASLEKGAEERFDAIVSDWQMPAISGLELLKFVRRTPQLREVPFMMLTCVDDEVSVKEAFLEGVTDYVVKPFTSASLEERVGKMLGASPKQKTQRL